MPTWKKLMQCKRRDGALLAPTWLLNARGSLVRHQLPSAGTEGYWQFIIPNSVLVISILRNRLFPEQEGSYTC